MWVSGQRSQLFSLRLSSELPRFTPLRLSSVGPASWQMMALTMCNVLVPSDSCIILLYTVQCYLKPSPDQRVDSSFFPSIHFKGTGEYWVLGSQLMYGRLCNPPSPTQSDREKHIISTVVCISRIELLTFPVLLY